MNAVENSNNDFKIIMKKKIKIFDLKEQYKKNF